MLAGYYPHEKPVLDRTKLALTVFLSDGYQSRKLYELALLIIMKSSCDISAVDRGHETQRVRWKMASCGTSRTILKVLLDGNKSSRLQQHWISTY
jgi:hypothetical protein